MEIVTMILSGLALLAASVCLILQVREKKRNEKRNAAVIQDVEAECKAVSKAVEARLEERLTELKTGMWDELNSRFDNIANKYNEISKSVSGYEEQFRSCSKSIEDIKDNVEKIGVDVMTAANQFQDKMSESLHNIWNFDPLEAVRKQREKNRYGGEVD